MVIIICFGANCQAVWDKQQYPTVNDCLAASGPVKEYMIQVYPTSAGQIYCMDEQQFKNYEEYLENGGEPTIESYNKPSS
jgi:hypothetical protein